MAGRHDGYLHFEFGSCLFSGYDQDGFPIAQLDAQGEEPGVDPAELHHQFGFASLPRDPEIGPDGEPVTGKACNLLLATEGNTQHAWLAYDPRYLPFAPKLKKGGSVQYCAPGSFRVMDGDDGTETLYVPVPGNKAHVVTTGLDGNGEPYLGIVHADGMALTMLEHVVVLKNAAGDAYLQVDDDGITLNGNIVATGGAVFGGTTALAAAIAPPLVTYLGSLETVLAGLAAAVDSKPTPASATAAAVASFISAGAALKTAMTALNVKVA